MKYRIEPLSEKNILDLIQLYKSVFKNKVTQKYVEKKFDTSFLINGYFGHIAFYNKMPVAFHGAIPVRMKYQENFEIAAQYGDAMTLPQHTGKGLFTQLGKRTDEQLQEAGITFVWGFPNQNSEYGYLNKLNWIYKDRIQGFKINTSVIPFEKIMPITSLSTTIYKQHIEKVFSKYKVKKYLKGSVYNNENVVSIARDTDFYNYKSFSENFVIEIEETLFWVKIKNGLLIGDLEIKTEDQFYKAIKTLKKIVSKCGIKEIIFQTSPNTQIEHLLKRTSANTFGSWLVGYKNFNSNFPLEKLKFTFGDLDTF